MQFGAGRVEGNRPGLFGDFHHLVLGYEQKLGIRIDKPGDQPGTGHVIDVDMGAGYPFQWNIFFAYTVIACCVFALGCLLPLLSLEIGIQVVDELHSFGHTLVIVRPGRHQAA